MFRDIDRRRNWARLFHLADVLNIDMQTLHRMVEERQRGQKWRRDKPVQGGIIEEDNRQADLYIFDKSEEELAELAEALQVDYQQLLERAKEARQKLLGYRED